MELAAKLLEIVRHVERNCRCHNCHNGVEWQNLACVECDPCREKMMGRMQALLSSCKTDRDRVMLRVMSEKSMKSKRPKAKAKAAKKPQLLKGAKKPSKVATVKSHSGPRLSGPKSGDSDRGLYVRFDSPEIKAKVKASADKSKVSMNAYIVAATLDWVKEGKQVLAAEDPKEEVAKAS